MSETTMPKQEFDKQSVEIERALPEDAEIICDIRDRAWIDAYPNSELGITPEDIKANAQGLHGEFVPRRVAHLKEKFAQSDRPDGSTFVAKVSGKVVGYVDPSIEEGKRRIGAIYVAPEVQGMGIGGRLMQQALEWHGRSDDIFLEVVSYNQNAINFYKRFGFVQTEAVVQDEPGRPDFMKSLPQIEMRLSAERPIQKYDWNKDIAPRLDAISEVSGGYSPAQRGVITIEDGTKLFIKVGTGEQTKKWLAKEVKVYQKLNEVGYPYIPRLHAVNGDNTGMAIEYLGDYNFADTWDGDKLNAVIEAQEALKPFTDLFADDNEFSPDSVVSMDDKWPTLLTDESIDWLSKKLPELGTHIEVTRELIVRLAAMNEDWSLKVDTLTHQDIRADNFGYDPDTKAGKLIDWNWLCVGDASLDTTPLFVNMYKFGFDPYEKHPEKYDPQMLAYLVSFWLESILSGRNSDEDRDLGRRQAQAENVRLCLELLERHGY